MIDTGDATGLIGSAIGLGVGLAFTGMMLNYTKDMTETMIKQGKKQGRQPQKRKGIRRQSPPNFFSAKNLNKPFRY